MSKLEDKCLICPELLADGYGKCDHRRCMDCVVTERLAKQPKTKIHYDDNTWARDAFM